MAHQGHAVEPADFGVGQDHGAGAVWSAVWGRWAEAGNGELAERQGITRSDQILQRWLREVLAK